MQNFNGTAQITDEGIKKHFKSMLCHESFFEYIWNGFDARASNVYVNLTKNSLGQLDFITIFDDGDGIDFSNLSNSFEKFNESDKKNDDNKHGSHGRGRLSFHKLANKAVWYTKWENKNAKIHISGDNISKYAGAEIEDLDQKEFLITKKSGTCVELSSLYSNAKLPSENDLIDSFKKEFSWFLIVNSDKKLYLNGDEITVLAHSSFEKNIEIEMFDFKIKVIRWHEKPSHEKSCNYLVDSNNKVIHRELSKANNKIDFYTSCYALSEWNDTYNKDELEMESNYANQQKILKKINKVMSDYLKVIYEEYLREYIDQKIDTYDEKGYFPSYIGYDNIYAEFRKKITKEAFKSIYLADPQVFAKLSTKPLKIIIRMLDKLLVSKENDAIFDVLDNVLDLSDTQVDLLAEQLKSTTLENIISTIETLQKRELAVNKLKELMDNHHENILETPDLQKIIENNTWLFGAQYEILGAEEDSFTKITQRLRGKVRGIDDIGTDDLDKNDAINAVVVDGLNRQVDLFLARKNKTFDTLNNPIYKCVIVEIKRPSASLNKKHMNQLLDYAEILSKFPEFNNGEIYFELILVGRKISKDDFSITSHLNSHKEKGEKGLVLHDGNIKCYVKNWYSIFQDFQLSNTYLLDNLKSKYEDLSTESKISLIDDLQGKQLAS